MKAELEHPRLYELVLTSSEINRHVKRVAGHVVDYYEQVGEIPLVVPILSGAMLFAGDLMVAMCEEGLDCGKVYPITASRYNGDSPSMKVIIEGFLPNVKNRRILTLDDICDEGVTLFDLGNFLMNKGAKDVKSCVFIEKPKECRIVDLNPDFVGFKLEMNKWVYGYGMDTGHPKKDEGRWAREVRAFK